MANFFKGMLRLNVFGNYGDLQGPMTNLNKGGFMITIEKGKCIAYIVGQPDIELSRENVQSVQPISKNQKVSDISGCGNKLCDVNIYRIKLKNGQEGTLRLLSGTEYKVLSLIQ